MDAPAFAGSHRPKASILKTPSQGCQRSRRNPLELELLSHPASSILLVLDPNYCAVRELVGMLWEIRAISGTSAEESQERRQTPHLEEIS